MSTESAASVETADEALLAHTKERLQLIREALDDDPESALNYIRDYAACPLYHAFDDVASLALDGAFPVFEECEAYVPCEGIDDVEILRRATRALADTGCEDLDLEPLHIEWRGHVLLLAEHSQDGDVMFWFRRVQPDERAILMAHVT